MVVVPVVVSRTHSRLSSRRLQQKSMWVFSCSRGEGEEGLTGWWKTFSSHQRAEMPDFQEFPEFRIFLLTKIKHVIFSGICENLPNNI